jgi:hypothetical protein
LTLQLSFKIIKIYLASFDYSKKESKIKLTPHAVVSGGSHVVMLIGVVIPVVSVPPL